MLNRSNPKQFGKDTSTILKTESFPFRKLFARKHTARITCVLNPNFEVEIFRKNLMHQKSWLFLTEKNHLPVANLTHYIKFLNQLSLNPKIYKMVDFAVNSTLSIETQ